MPANALDLCLADDVAGDLSVASDAKVQRCVTAASAAIARACIRTFEQSSLTEAPAGAGRPRFLVARPPIVSIASVVEFGAELDADEYSIEGSFPFSEMVLRKHGIWPRTGVHGGFVTESLSFYAPNPDVLSISYVGGFITPGQNALDAATYPAVTLPEDIQEAAIHTAAQMYLAGGMNPQVAAESIGDWSATYRAGSEAPLIPTAAMALLEPYMLRRAN